ncbi:unnamed protein product [Protopolystoma xenopodis]|uniref:Uncharacterized protein n=1 Tax=Protopolystoma xenopodis TaxID=117903 RepID=A0A448WL46_9PLAT|nr:unnamed protein product [Protopolystoma xenopodis]
MWEFMSKHEKEVFVNSTQDGVTKVRQGNYAFILESTWNEYYVQRDCRLMQVGGMLDSKGYGIGLQQVSAPKPPSPRLFVETKTHPESTGGSRGESISHSPTCHTEYPSRLDWVVNSTSPATHQHPKWQSKRDGAPKVTTDDRSETAESVLVGGLHTDHLRLYLLFQSANLSLFVVVIFR